MKKNSLYECGCQGQRSKVTGQKNINGKSNVFAISVSSNKVSRDWEFSRSSVEGMGAQPITFRGPGSSANHVSRGWGLVQSGFEERVFNQSCFQEQRV